MVARSDGRVQPRHEASTPQSVTVDPGPPLQPLLSQNLISKADLGEVNEAAAVNGLQCEFDV